MENNPYRVVFASLPFEEAIEFSIKYAMNKVDKFVDERIEFYKELDLAINCGMIIFDSTASTYNPPYENLCELYKNVEFKVFGIDPYDKEPSKSLGVVSMVQS